MNGRTTTASGSTETFKIVQTCAPLLPNLHRGAGSFATLFVLVRYASGQEQAFGGVIEIAGGVLGPELRGALALEVVRRGEPLHFRQAQGFLDPDEERYRGPRKRWRPPPTATARPEPAPAGAPGHDDAGWVMGRVRKD